jgi:DNA-binding response OmpR family regulator
MKSGRSLLMEGGALAKILIVDGDPDVVAAGRIVLEREGHAVLTAPELSAGLRVIEESFPDLLLIDCMIGGPDGGLRAAREIRDHGHSIPILLLSIDKREAKICAFHDNEMVDVGRLEEKPMDPEALSKSVKLLLEGGEEASCFWPRGRD